MRPRDEEWLARQVAGAADLMEAQLIVSVFLATRENERKAQRATFDGKLRLIVTESGKTGNQKQPA